MVNIYALSKQDFTPFPTASNESVGVVIFLAYWYKEVYFTKGIPHFEHIRPL